MSFSFIPFLIVLVSLVIIIVIIVRKFPQLTLLDVDTIPEVKEGKLKDEFIKRKMDKQRANLWNRIVLSVEPIIRKLKQIQLSFRKYVGKVERELIREKRKQQSLDTGKKKNKKDKRAVVKNLLLQADQAVTDEDYDMAEKKYIEAIRIDSKNKQAYKGLAMVYVKNGHEEEAEETYRFLLQMDNQDDDTYMKLAELEEKRGDLKKAVEYYQQAVLFGDQVSSRFFKLSELLSSIDENETALEAASQAVELEPNNPRYLDNLVEIAILVGDKNAAKEAWGQLRLVNPDNKKLDVLRDKIRQI